MGVWLCLIGAAVTEVGWVTGLKAAAGPWGWSTTVICALASLWLAAWAARSLPATTVYILFMGMGASGTVVVDLLVFGASLHPATLGFLALLIAGVVGLKLTAAREH